MNCKSMRNGIASNLRPERDRHGVRGRAGSIYAAGVVSRGTSVTYVAFGIGHLNAME